MVSSFLTWLILTSALLEFELPVWYPHYGASAIAAMSEIALFILSNIFIRKYGLFDLISFSIQGLRICTLVILLSFYTTLWKRKSFEEDDEERQSLLPENSKPVGNVNGTGYGTTTNTNDNSQDGNSSDSDEDDVLAKRRNKAQERVQKRLETEGNWWAYVKGFSVCTLRTITLWFSDSFQIFIPHVWPVHDKAMQFRAVAVGACLLTGNFLNIMIPRQLGVVTDALVKGKSPIFGSPAKSNLL